MSGIESELSVAAELLETQRTLETTTTEWSRAWKVEWERAEAAEDKAKGLAVEAGFNKGRRERAEAELAQARELLSGCLRVVDAVLGHVTGYDAVPYQDALRDARAFLASMTEAEREAAIEMAARAYYEWCCVGSEPSRWSDASDGDTHRTFAKARAEVMLDALLDSGHVVLRSQLDEARQLLIEAADDGIANWPLEWGHRVRAFLASGES